MVKIYATTDVHGYVEKLGELQNLVTADDLLIDVGDFFVGSPQTTYFNAQLPVSPLVEVANQLQYDVMVPGNHDFDYGIDHLQKQIQHLKARYLCANLMYNNDEPIFEPFQIFERGGLRIGVIGVVTSLLSVILQFEKSKEFKCLNVIETLRKWLPVLQQEADFILVAYHGGLERNLETGAFTQYDTGEDEAYKILLNFPEIDVLLCGHQHRSNVGNVGKSLLLQPGHRGQQIGVATLPTREGELLETSDKVPLKIPFNQADYEAWLQSEVDTSYLEDYLKRLSPDADELDIQLKGKTVQDFLESFNVPYSVCQYRLESGVRILTNRDTYPSYRLEKQFVTNIFDEYLGELSQKNE